MAPMGNTAPRSPPTRTAPPRTEPPTLELVVPVHNEVRTLGSSITQLHRYLTERFPWTWRITIVDNASADGTWDEANRLCHVLDDVEARHLEAKGRGRALRAAWLASDATVVAYTDVDLSTDLDALLPLVAPLVIGHSDLSIGSRLTAGARVQRGPRRELLSRIYNRLLHVVLGSRFRDAQCGFKAVRADVARRLLPEVKDNGWFFDTELLLLAERNGLRISEIPVDWIDDADSRVAVLRTGLEDLQGMGRMAIQFWTGRGRLDLGSLGRAPAQPGTGGEIVSFLAVGVASTIAYLLLFFWLRGLIGALASNVVALTTTMVANTAVHRRWTFGRSGPGDRKREWTRAAAVHAVGLALTSLALVGAEALDGGATTTELLLLGMASGVATLMRLLLMPAWVFRRIRR